MKVIGITRRMDDLGRVVIPKEVRQSLGINEGDFLEIVGTEWKGKSLFVTPIIAEGEVIGFICYKNDKESAHDMIRLSAQFLAQFAEN